MATGLIFKIFIWYWNAVDLQCCVLGVQQPDSVRQRHRFILFWILFPYRLLQSVEESPLGCVALTICFIFRRAYILIPDGSMRDTGGEGLTPGSGRSLRRRNGSSLQYSCWRTPWTEEPGRLQSMESQRVRHDWMIKYTSESQPPNLSLPPGFFFFFFGHATWHMESSSLTRDRIRVPCIGGAEPSPLDCQRSPRFCLFFKWVPCTLYGQPGW